MTSGSPSHLSAQLVSKELRFKNKGFDLVHNCQERTQITNSTYVKDACLTETTMANTATKTAKSTGASYHSRAPNSSYRGYI